MTRRGQFVLHPGVQIVYLVQGAIAEDLIPGAAANGRPLLKRVFTGGDADLSQMISGARASKKLLLVALHLIRSCYRK